MHVFGFAGYSGAGKTTLIEQLIPVLTSAGLRVSLLKHTHHDFDIDKPGKDSWRFRVAGAGEVMLAGAQRWALMHELRDEAEPLLSDLLAHMSPCDLVLVEGFRADDIPKIEVYRPSTGRERLHPLFPGVVAVASDVRIDSDLPWLDINNVQAVAAFVRTYLGI
jgi:molybdopterin-guanine dinucleotide biosynthesis adapter protein